LLERAHIEHARLLIVASSDPHVSPLIVERAKALNPNLDFVVRTQSDEEAAQLRAISPKAQAVHMQRELAVQMARYSLRRFGVNAVEAEAIAQGLRGRPLPAARPSGPSRWTRLRERAGALARRSPDVRAPATQEIEGGQHPQPAPPAQTGRPTPVDQPDQVD
jgi:hypothetical protein